MSQILGKQFAKGKVIAVKNSVTESLEGHLRNLDLIPEIIWTVDRGDTGQEHHHICFSEKSLCDHVGNRGNGTGGKWEDYCSSPGER